MQEQINILDLIAFIVNEKTNNFRLTKVTIQSTAGENPRIKGHSVEVLKVTKGTESSLLKVINNTITDDLYFLTDEELELIMQTLSNIILENIYSPRQEVDVLVIYPEEDSTTQILEAIDRLSKNLF